MIVFTIILKFLYRRQEEGSEASAVLTTGLSRRRCCVVISVVCTAVHLSHCGSLSVGEDFVKSWPSHQSGPFELKQSRAAFLFLGSNCSQLFAGLLSLI